MDLSLNYNCVKNNSKRYAEYMRIISGVIYQLLSGHSYPGKQIVVFFIIIIMK